MIAFVKGILDSVSEDKIIVENQNIGFEILVPGSVVSELPQEIQLRFIPIHMCAKMRCSSMVF